MKKFLVLAALALAMVGSATQAEAKWAAPERVKWQRSNTTEGIFALAPYTTGASAKVDTSAIFSLNDCVPVSPAAMGDSVNFVGTLGAPSRSGVLQDTTMIARIVISCDSTTATTQAWGSPSVAVQVRYSPNGSWSSAVTIAPKPTDAAKFCVFPFLFLPATNDYGIETAQYGWWVGADVRFIITWGTGNVNSAYVSLQKHIPD